MDATDKRQEKRRKNWLNPLIALIGVIVIYVLSQIIAVNVVGAVGIFLGYPETEVNTWINSSEWAMFSVRLLVAVAVIWLSHVLLKWCNSTWRSIGLTRPRLKHVGSAVIGYGWYMLLFIGTSIIVGQLVPSLDRDQQQQLGFDRMSMDTTLLLLSAVALVILAPIYEEILFRGVLFTGLRKKLPLITTGIIVSVIFGAAHLEWGGDSPLNWAAAIDTAVFSMVLVYLRETSKSLWPAIFLHGLKNAIAFTLVFVLKVT